jgi:hypothetical protein
MPSVDELRHVVLGREFCFGGVLLCGRHSCTWEPFDANNDPNFVIGHCGYLELPLGRYKLVLGATELDLNVVLASEGYHHVVTFDGFIKGFNTCRRPMPDTFTPS